MIRLPVQQKKHLFWAHERASLSSTIRIGFKDNNVRFKGIPQKCRDEWGSFSEHLLERGPGVCLPGVVLVVLVVLVVMVEGEERWAIANRSAQSKQASSTSLTRVASRPLKHRIVPRFYKGHGLF